MDDAYAAEHLSSLLARRTLTSECDRGRGKARRKIYGANCWPDCHFERGGRKCSRKKLWRPDVSGVGGGREIFFGN